MVLVAPSKSASGLGDQCWQRHDPHALRSWHVMATAKHKELLTLLLQRGGHAWSAQALLSCLLRLNDGGDIERELVEVLDAWEGPGDAFSVVYRPPWDKRSVGIYRNRLTDHAYVYPLSGPPESINAEEFGDHVARWDIGEPLGYDIAGLWRDSAGIHWWGDIGLPSSRAL